MKNRWKNTCGRVRHYSVEPVAHIVQHRIMSFVTVGAHSALPDLTRIDPKFDCWVFHGGENGNGYGVITVNSKPVLAHRASYELANGPIADGLHVLHACDNPVCVRPSHLRVGTNRDNVQDRQKAGRQMRGETHCDAKLTEDQVVEILLSLEPTRVLAEKYLVSYYTIWNIRAGRTWRHISDALPPLRPSPFL